MATHRRRGGAAIEFAFVAPVLLGLVFGVMEYGWMFLQQSNITSAVRDGVRLGVTYAEEDDPEGEAIARTQAVLDSYNMTCDTPEAVIEGTSPEKVLRVTATCPYNALIGWKGLVPEALQAEMTMLLELQD